MIVMNMIVINTIPINNVGTPKKLRKEIIKLFTDAKFAEKNQKHLACHGQAF